MVPLDAPALLDRLGYTADESVSVSTQPRGGVFSSQVVPSSTVGVLPTGLDVWLGVNPVRPRTTGRGTASDVTRLAALWADLDVKPGGCPDLPTAYRIIDALATMLPTRPVAVTFSGHGLQPFWAIEDAPLDTDTQRARARALLRRWGRLVAHVAEIHHSQVDSVFDLPRVLRAPGTVNHKAAPVPVVTFADNGRPLSLDELEEVLLEYNVPQRPGDSEGLGQVLSRPAEWAWASSTCRYAKTTTEAWLTETPSARHPWLMSAAVRLACMHRYGCLTEADYGDAQRRLVAHFHALLDQGSPKRQASPGEVADAFFWGGARASTKTGQELAAELGDHPHRDDFEDIVVTPVGQVDTTTGEVHEASQDDSGATSDDPGERARRLFPRLDWHVLWGDDDEEEWIHEPLLAARRLVSLYSAPKVGKSLLMLELAVGISRGEPVLGYTPSRRWRVLYVDFENDPRGDGRSRLQAMGYGPDDLDHIDYLSFPTMAGLDSERGGLELLEAIRAYGSEVVVIDTVSRAVDGEENSNDTWLGLYRHTGLKLKQAGVAAIRLDHSGKDESKGTRGGSAKSGDVDAIWKLTRVTDERFRLECTESRMQINTKSMQLTRRRLPRLHHTVDVLSGVSDHEAKVLHLLDLANANGLAGDANREAVRMFAATRGIKASGRVVQDMIRRRKGELPPEFTPPPAHLADDESSPSSAPGGNGDSEHGTGELLPRVQQSSPPLGEPELSAAVRSTAEQFTPLTPEDKRCTHCLVPMSELRVAVGKTLCVGCEETS